MYGKTHILVHRASGNARLFVLSEEYLSGTEPHESLSLHWLCNHSLVLSESNGHGLVVLLAPVVIGLRA